MADEGTSAGDDGRRIVSVRTRIVATITIVAALGMLAVGIALYGVERARIIAQIDDRLTANVESARYIVGEGPRPNADGSPRGWSSATEALETVVQRMSPDDNTGAVGIANGRAAYTPGVPLDVDLLDAAGFVPHVVATVRDEPRLGTYADDGVTWRYVAVPIHLADSPSPDAVVFAMAYDVEAELDEINEAARVYLITVAIVLVVIAASASIVASRLLRPVRRMREMADRISARSLDERLPVSGHDDVSALAGTMNAMLDRLDEALESQRRLLGDVGHELKTPLTIVRGYLDVMDAADADDVRETQSLVTDELDRMARLVQDLGAAARLHGPAPVSPRQVDAGDLMHQIVRKAEGIEGAHVTAGPIAEVVAPLDPARVTQAVLQLAQNAVTHGGGRIVIGSDATATDLRVWVRDHGPGVPTDLREAIFDRFHRSADGGSGLGLNIVQVIARAHGGDAYATDPPTGPGALVAITLPRGTAAENTDPEGRSGRGIDPHRR